MNGHAVDILNKAALSTPDHLWLAGYIEGLESKAVDLKAQNFRLSCRVTKLQDALPTTGAGIRDHKRMVEYADMRRAIELAHHLLNTSPSDDKMQQAALVVLAQFVKESA